LANDREALQGGNVLWSRHVRRLNTLVLVLGTGASLALTGCGGSSSSPAAPGGTGGTGTAAAGGGGSGGSGGDSAPCAAFAAAYKKFLAGYVPPERQTGTEETPLLALSNAVDKITAAGQLETDLSDLGIDAGLIATGSTEGGYTTPPSAFGSDLQSVGKDCGTTFTQPPASLVREG
jgi:hypothetical protein